VGSKGSATGETKRVRHTKVEKGRSRIRRCARQAFSGVIPFLITCIVLGWASAASAKKGVYDWAFVRLDYARRDKVQTLEKFCDRIHNLARQAARDKSVVGCFDVNLQYAAMVEKGGVPEVLSETVEKMRENFNRYYIEKYFSFYDILFVDREGRVFYTLRKESDINQNLVRGNPVSGPLAECLRGEPREEAFVDFHDYGPSSKPAAFFVEPIHKDGTLLGWVILQCAVNKVNTLFAWEENLGQTGETFLVNRNGFMLTESNFDGDSTILKKRLDDRNIQAKFSEGQGHRVVTDYRGCTALTSFEVVHFLGTHWLVVAKVDRDEIVTQHYINHRTYYADQLLASLRGASVPSLRRLQGFSMDGLRVDMDEFLKANKGESLYTIGIATCTGLLVAYPGRFAYLAHVSTRDRVYGAGDTNLLGQVVKQVKSFDIRPCEKRRIVFVAVANHLDSLLAVVDKLVAEGFLLSQIRVSYNPGAASAAVRYDYQEELFAVGWRMDGVLNGFHLMEDTLNVGEVVEGIIYKEEKES